MSKEEVVKFYVTCLSCDYKWEPEPKKWRNLNGIIRTGRKLIFCPVCNARINLSKEDTQFLLTGKRSDTRATKLLKRRKKRRRLEKHAKTKEL